MTIPHDGALRKNAAAGKVDVGSVQMIDALRDDGDIMLADNEHDDPRGVCIDAYFNASLLRPGAGLIVQQTGQPQYCGSVVFRIVGYDETPHNIDPTKISRRFAGEFLGITHEGKEIGAVSGYLPYPIDGAIKRVIDRGRIAEFAGDVWCEPREGAPLGYRFTIYDRRPRQRWRRR